MNEWDVIWEEAYSAIKAAERIADRFREPQECQCPVCYRVFTGLQGFDRHLNKEQGKLRCIDPQTLGYTLDWKGRWTKGSGERRTFG